MAGGVGGGTRGAAASDAPVVAAGAKADDVLERMFENTPGFDMPAFKFDMALIRVAPLLWWGGVVVVPDPVFEVIDPLPAEEVLLYDVNFGWSSSGATGLMPGVTEPWERQVSNDKLP